MSWQVRDNATELIRLRKDVTKIRDALFITGGSSNLPGSLRIGGASGQGASQGQGNTNGVVAIDPAVGVLTEVDSNGIPTGTFDKLNLINSNMIVDAVGALDLRFIQGTTADGQILYLKPLNGKTLTLKTGGNIDIVSDVTVNDNQCAIIVFYEDNTTPDANGNYVVATVSSAGGSGGYNLIQDEGIALPAQTTIDFQGAGVVATNGAGKTIVTISGAAGGMATDLNNMVSPTVPTVDLSMNGRSIINVDDIKAFGGTNEIGESGQPFDNMYALRFQPPSSTPLSGTRGLARTAEELYINVDATGGEFVIRESGNRDIIFRVFSFLSFASSMIFDAGSSQILFGQSGVHGQIGFDGSNTVIDRRGGGGLIILRNNLTDILEVGANEVTLRKNIEMNANRIFDCAELGASFGGMIIAQTGGVSYMGMSGLAQIQHLTASDNEIFLNSLGNMLFHVGAGDRFIMQIAGSQHYDWTTTSFNTDNDVNFVNASGARLDFDGSGIALGATAGFDTLPANPVAFVLIKIGGALMKIPYYNL